MTVTEFQAVAGAPEVGQLVRVRDRHWVVSDVVASTLDGDRPQHLIELTSVEDDGLGDELTVIWEIEPGTAILETATLPRPQFDRFDDPERLDAFLDAVRWGAITSTDAEPSRPPSGPVSPSRTTSSTQSCGPCRCRGSTSSLPTTWASVRRSRRARGPRATAAPPRPHRPRGVPGVSDAEVEGRDG